MYINHLLDPMRHMIVSIIAQRHQNGPCHPLSLLFIVVLHFQLVVLYIISMQKHILIFIILYTLFHMRLLGVIQRKILLDFTSNSDLG